MIERAERDTIPGQPVKYDQSALSILKGTLELYAGNIRGSSTPLETTVQEILNELEALVDPTAGSTESTEG